MQDVLGTFYPPLLESVFHTIWPCKVHYHSQQYCRGSNSIFQNQNVKLNPQSDLTPLLQAEMKRNTYQFHTFIG